MFFLDLDRFSVDLDFELIKNNEDTEYKKELMETLLKITKTLWLQVKESFIKRNTIFIMLDYGWGKPIKVEISTRNIIDPIFEFFSFYGTKVPVMDRAIQASYKLVAIATRKKQRDVYDLNFYIKRWILPEKTVTQTVYTVVAGKRKVFSTIASEAIAVIKNSFNEKNILSWIGDLISESKKQQIRSSLINETTMMIEMLK